MSAPVFRKLSSALREFLNRLFIWEAFREVLIVSQFPSFQIYTGQYGKNYDQAKNYVGPEIRNS